MGIKVELGSLDDLNCAVMMCSVDGTVIYKNKLAMKEIRLPKRFTHVQGHLSSAELRRFERLDSDERASVIVLDTGDVKVRAFVTPYVRNSEPCTLWVFVPFVQTAAASKYLYLLEDDIVTLADDICEIVKCIDERDSIPANKGMGKGALDRRISAKVDKIIGYLFFSSGETRYPVSKALSLLFDATEQSFSKFGYDIKYSLKSSRENLLSFVDMKSFCVFYFHLIAFFADCGVDGHINVAFEADENDLKINLVTTMPYPPAYFYGESDIEKLALLSPGNIIDVLLFQRFAFIYKYKLTYTLNEDFVDNLNVSIEIPLITRNAVSDIDKTDEMDIFYLKTDLLVSFMHMLRARTFDPELQELV